MLTISIKGLRETEEYWKALSQGELKFGIAKGLTSLANGIREKVQQDLPQKFTLRTTWWKRGPYAIKTDKATKQTLTSRVYTDAPWMRLQETGGTKMASGKRLALPTANVRRTKRDLIPKSQKPLALQKAFFIKTKKGIDFLAMRTGRGVRSKLQLMWMMQKTAKIEPRFGFHTTAQQVIDRVGLLHIQEGIKYALETSKR